MMKTMFKETYYLVYFELKNQIVICGKTERTYFCWKPRRNYSWSNDKTKAFPFPCQHAAITFATKLSMTLPTTNVVIDVEQVDDEFEKYDEIEEEWKGIKIDNG